MDLKQAYESIIQALKRQLDAEMPLAKEADDTLVAKGLLYDPTEAAALFVDPIEGQALSFQLHQLGYRSLHDRSGDRLRL